MNLKKIFLILLLFITSTAAISAKGNVKSIIVNDKPSYGFGQIEQEYTNQLYNQNPNNGCFDRFLIFNVTRDGNKSYTIKARYGNDLDFRGAANTRADVQTGVGGAKRLSYKGTIEYRDRHFTNVLYTIPIDKNYSGRTIMKLSVNEGRCKNSIQIHHYTGREHDYSNLVFTLSPIERRDRVLDWQQSTNAAMVFDSNNRWNQHFSFNKEKNGYSMSSLLKPNHHIGVFSNKDVSISNSNACVGNYQWNIKHQAYRDTNQSIVKLQNVQNKLYLDVPYSNYANRNQLVTYHNTNNPNQEFLINAMYYTK